MAGRRDWNILRRAPETLQVIVLTGLGRENMHQEITVVGKYPFGLIVPFEADRHFADLLEFKADFLADGLNLLRIGAGADDEVVRERRDAGKVEDLDVFRLLGFGGAYRNEP